MGMHGSAMHRPRGSAILFVSKHSGASLLIANSRHAYVYISVYVHNSLHRMSHMYDKYISIYYIYYIHNIWCIYVYVYVA